MTLINFGISIFCYQRTNGGNYGTESFHITYKQVGNLVFVCTLIFIFFYWGVINDIIQTKGCVIMNGR